MDPPATTFAGNTVTPVSEEEDVEFKDQVRSDIYTYDGEPLVGAPSSVVEEENSNLFHHKDQVARAHHPDAADEEEQRVPMSMLEIVEAVPVSGVTDKDLIGASDLFDSDGQRYRRRGAGSDVEIDHTKRFFCVAMILALASFLVAIVVAVLCLTGRCKSPVSMDASIPQASPAQPSSPTSRPQAPPVALAEPQRTNAPSLPAATTAPTRSPLAAVPVQPPTSPPTSVAPTAVPNAPLLPLRSTEIINFINEISLVDDDGVLPLRYPVPPDEETTATPEERSLSWLIDVDTEAITTAATTTSSTRTQQSLRQRYALSTLWFQTLDPFFTDAHTSTWTNPSITNECDWLDVECNSNGAIVRLNLEASNVRGQLPADLALLTELTTIRLWENAIRGTLPSAWRRMTQLRELRLWDNQLSGTIPSWIGEMTALRLLELDINALEGTIPSELGLLSALTIVDLAPNNLTGNIPTALLQLTELRELLLNNNDLTGTMPFCFAEDNLDRFAVLVVDCNQVECPCCTEC